HCALNDRDRGTEETVSSQNFIQLRQAWWAARLPNISPVASTTTGPKSIAACSFFRFSSASDRKCGPHRALSITLLRYGITKQRHKPIAWCETAPEERAPAEGNGCPFAFVTYERRSAAAPPSDTGNQRGLTNASGQARHRALQGPVYSPISARDHAGWVGPV